MTKRSGQFHHSGPVRALASFCAAAMLWQGLPALAVSAFAEEEARAGHVHTDSCYSTGRHLVCPLEESEGHRHTEECWGLVRGELLCTDNTGEHIHGDDCYNWSFELICGLEEGEGAHTHGEDCYEEEQVLICGLEEGEEEPEAEEDPADGAIDEAQEETQEDEQTGETDETEEPDEAGEADSPAEEESAPEEIIYGPGDGITSMLQYERELCFADVSDPTADLEDETDWWRMFADMELTGVWADDLLTVAYSQLGYTESELNFDDSDPWHPKGYTRYGAWFGVPYGDWCAMFISFCLYYAEIPDSAVPYNCHCSEWVRELRERGMYRHWDEGYAPRPGDFVFFDFDLDEKADHVGIVTGTDDNRGWLYTIEGNRYDYVESFILTKYDCYIIGYGVLPENPNYNPGGQSVERQNGRVELPPDPVEPTPPAWDSLLDAAEGIKSVTVTPEIVASRVTN